MNKDIKKIKSSQYLDRYDIISIDIPYGIEEIGDVPRLALVIRLTPRELTNNPIRKII